MADKKFVSSLSEAEIKENFKGCDVFSGIKSGLEEALSFEQGTAKAVTIARKRSLLDINDKKHSFVT